MDSGCREQSSEDCSSDINGIPHIPISFRQRSPALLTVYTTQAVQFNMYLFCLLRTLQVSKGLQKRSTNSASQFDVVEVPMITLVLLVDSNADPSMPLSLRNFIFKMQTQTLYPAHKMYHL
jgi:hypothetical protein